VRGGEGVGGAQEQRQGYVQGGGVEAARDQAAMSEFTDRAQRSLFNPPCHRAGYVRNWPKADTTAAKKHEAALRLLRGLSLLSGGGRG
jgi:hypothetical protein